MNLHSTFFVILKVNSLPSLFFVLFFLYAMGRQKVLYMRVCACVCVCLHVVCVKALCMCVCIVSTCGMFFCVCVCMCVYNYMWGVVVCVWVCVCVCACNCACGVYMWCVCVVCLCLWLFAFVYISCCVYSEGVEPDRGTGAHLPRSLPCSDQSADPSSQLHHCHHMLTGWLAEDVVPRHHGCHIQVKVFTEQSHCEDYNLCDITEGLVTYIR